MIETNANTPSAPLAGDLATAPSAVRASFIGLIYTCQGVMRGRGAGRKRYGDDQIHATIVAGFSYRGLMERDLEALLEFLGRADLSAELDALAARGSKGWIRPRAKNASQVPVTAAHIRQALDELIEARTRFLNNGPTPSKTEYFEPLEVNGSVVRGARVYRGHPTDPSKNASEPGTIYLSGLVISRQVLTPAANGYGPKTRSGPVVVAKRMLIKHLELPSRRFRTYRLRPLDNWVLNMGGDELTSP